MAFALYVAAMERTLTIVNVTIAVVKAIARNAMVAVKMMLDPGTFALGFMAGIVFSGVIILLAMTLCKGAPKDVKRSDSYDLQRFVDE